MALCTRRDDYAERYQGIINDQLPDGDDGAVETDAPVRYQIVNSVPEHWIPFIPVHVEGSSRAVQLQRASLPRILANDPDVPKKVEAHTSVLRQALDETPPEPCILHEEEVTSAGVRVRMSYQRTRWHSGRAATWLGILKMV